MTVNACTLRNLPKFSDDRGSLSFAEIGQHVPFGIERIYYLYDMPPSVTRGAHAHKELEQLIIAISGEFDVEVDDGFAKRTIRLSRPDEALYICPMIWRDLHNFSSGAVCLVLASEKYDESDYIRSYEEFRRIRRSA